MNYSDSINSLRKAKGVTQQDVADAIGTSRQIVSRWEIGVNVPSLYYAEKLAAFFGVSIDELMGRSEEKVTGREPDKAGIDEPAAAGSHILSGLKSKLRLISFFTFAPALFFCLFWFIEQAVIEAYAVAGIPWEEYYLVIYCLYFFNALFNESLLVALGAFAMYFFVRALKGTDNTFMRFNIYSAFKNVCFFWLWNVLNIVYLNWIGQKIDPRILGVAACVLGSSLLASFVVLSFDIIFKKVVTGSWMVVETSGALKKVNTVYLALSAANIVQYLVLLTLSLTMWKGELIVMLTNYLIFAFVALLLQGFYAAARVRISRQRRNNEL